MMQKVGLIFDGGSRGNPGEMFGSCMIKVAGEPALLIRLRMGHGTNNEAEYLSLLSGLETVIEVLKRRKVPVGKAELEIRGDSQLVINQLSGLWKAKDARMRAYRDQARRHLRRFGCFHLLHQPRQASLRILGH